FLAVRKLKPDAPSGILCFVGPPGVGKTSLGRSIATAMGREFQRMSVGGVRDESEIRGHRRTYVGAIPGTIIRAIRDAGTANPVAGYTEEEKLEIAKRYLVPRQVERNGLTRGKIEITEEALRLIIEGYTREAGVRSLEREIGAICRKVAREYAEGTRNRKKTIRPKHVSEMLGKRRFLSEAGRRTDHPGVATGLAWTPVGGDVLFVEATAYTVEGRLQ